MLVLPQWFYGFFNFFSGCSPYEMYLYQFFNIFYTSMPIVIYAIIDREFSGKLLERTPAMYIQGLKGELFNTKRFWSWVMMGTCQSMIIIFCAYYGLNANFVNEEGQNAGFWESGTIVFGACVIVANWVNDKDDIANSVYWLAERLYNYGVDSDYFKFKEEQK